MKQLITIILIFSSFYFTSMYGQEEEIDSLKSVIPTLKEDTNKVNALNTLSVELCYNKPEDAIKYGKDALGLAEELNFQKGKAKALRNIGLGYEYLSNDFMAIEYLYQSMEIFIESGSRKGESYVLDDLARVYSDIGMPKKANDLQKASIEIAKQSGDSLDLAYLYNNMGYDYSNNTDQYQSAIESFSKALEFSQCQKVPFWFNGLIYKELGKLYSLQNKYDSAQLYFEKALADPVSIDSSFIPSVYINLGKLHSKKEEYTIALDYYQQAYSLTLPTKDKILQIQSLVGVAYTYYEIKNYNQALLSFIEAEKIGKEKQATKELKDVYEGLIKTYERLEHYKNALKYQNLLINVNEELLSSENDKVNERLKFTSELKYKSDSTVYASTIENLELQNEREKRAKIIYLVSSICFVLVLIIISYFVIRIRKQKSIIQKEKSKSDELLLNILPSTVADELKITGKSTARNFNNVSVLFTDFKEFTKIAETLNANELVEEIDTCFKAFDQIITNNNIEKIKTIGDAYMAAGGLHSASVIAAKNVIKAGIDMQSFMKSRKVELQKKNKSYFEMRVGIHTGPVVAGIVGVKKFQYDIWGNTVNIANRMERSGEIGRLNISETTYNLIKDDPELGFEYRGKILAKNKGELDMYFVDVVSHHTMPS